MDILHTLKEFDTELFLFFNSKHNAFFDAVMYWFSHKFFWIPLYAFFLFLAYRFYGKKVWLILLAAALAVLLADQISTQAFKHVFLRYRPCHNLLLQSKIHLNGNCGGMYGFISSHAANTFAIAMFLFLILKPYLKKYMWLLFVWAGLVSYSRIYNGVHYPADIAVGAIVGMAIGIAVFILFQFANKKIKHE